MPSVPPEGEPVPTDGALPRACLAEAGRRGVGMYVHVPFCASRCGYCDFNTYTADQLNGSGFGGTAGNARDSYVDPLVAEIALAQQVLAGTIRGVDTVFVGGGTPTLLSTDALARVLGALDDAFGLASGAEVTVEANPESVDEAYLSRLVRAGFNRLSLGMQSTAPHVLALLDRQHTPGRAIEMVEAAKAAGFAHVNVDLIYATPGESTDDFASSLTAALDSGADHISAYSLIVEEGTRLHTRIRRGELTAVDDDLAADRYLQAEALLTAAGFSWYEVSNWARTVADRCRHNMIYWQGGDWWGFGPGAHSHIAGVRWWNVRHPTAYQSALAAGRSPGQARELLTPQQRSTERIMLELRTTYGLELSVLDDKGYAAATRAAADGLLDRKAFEQGRAVLTVSGRLLADLLITRLIG